MRMEDLDPPREEPGAGGDPQGAGKLRLRVGWRVVRQSDRHDAYAEVLNACSTWPGLRLHLLAQAMEPYHGIYPGCAAMPGDRKMRRSACACRN
jgi:glutamyl-Q tRNA(Asp) synthetase